MQGVVGNQFSSTHAALSGRGAQKQILINLIAASLLLLTVSHRAEAATFLSNLDTQWTAGGIGDIHALFPGGTPNGTDTAHFTTGSGGGFSLDTITLEFDRVPPSPAWGNVRLELFQQSNNLLLGSLGNPVVNPKPTQWPSYTTFIDFSPSASIYLNPHTQYALVVSVPANSPSGAGLLFARSSYYTPTDWTMQVTTSGNPYAFMEYLVMAVGATQIPEPNTVALLIGGLMVLSGGRNPRANQSKIRSNEHRRSKAHPNREQGWRS
jgi:hypothetical protein